MYFKLTLNGFRISSCQLNVDQWHRNFRNNLKKLMKKKLNKSVVLIFQKHRIYSLIYF